MSIFSTGLEALESIQEEAKRIEERKPSNLRVWFKPGEKKIFRMLLPAPIVFYQHVFNKGRDRYVCTDHKNGCAICKALNDNPVQTGIMPVRYIDAPLYNDKPQNNRIFMWQMSHGVLKTMAILINKYGDKLVDKLTFEIERKKDNQNSKDYVFLPEMDELEEIDTTLIKEVKALDWSEEVKAPTEERIKALIAGGTIGESLDRRDQASATGLGRSIDYTKKQSEAPPFPADEEPTGLAPADQYI